ncbi:hypothetical protein ACU686_29215 [Yinghuangia aomiensis]
MGAIADTYGIADGTVRALAAGADAVCVGGGLCDEDTVLLLRDAIVARRPGRPPRRGPPRRRRPPGRRTRRLDHVRRGPREWTGRATTPSAWPRPAARSAWTAPSRR